MRLRRSHVLWLLFCASLSSACLSPSPAKELADQLQTTTSWAATAHMAGEAWMRREVPDAYARQTLEATQEELAAVEQQFSDETDGGTADARRNISAHLDKLQAAVGGLQAMVEAGDRANVAARLNDVAKEAEAIRNLAGEAKRRAEREGAQR